MSAAPRYPVPQAISALGLRGHHAVEASAGTGKTFLIERRVVDLVLRGGATIDQILLVTFTEKATAELRRRVRALLRELATLVEDRARPVDDEPAWTIDGPARTALRAALAAYDQAAIHTIHGYCHRVLVDCAFDGARRFRETRIGTETALREALCDSLRDSLAGSDGALLEAWFGQRRSLDTLAGLLATVTRLGGHIAKGYQPELLEERIATVAAADRDAVTSALKRARVNASTGRAVMTRLATLADLAERAGGGLAPLLDEVATASAELCGYLERPQLAAAVPELAAAALALDEAALPLDAAVVTRFLPVVSARLEKNKAERGQLDYGDMLEQVWRALDGPAGAELAARLRARHPHALIDEFQDTDELQWKIFRRIYLDSAGEANLTVVGDPKQAIYGFRGADLATYLAARGELLAGREPVRLETSHRSSAGLVAALDGILGGEPAFFTGGIEYRPVSAAKQGAAPEPPLVLFDLGAFESLEERRAALAARISREIGSLEVAPEKIFVLTRTVQESRQMADRLRADGIRCAFVQQEGLMQTAEASEVRDLFAAIAAPRDRSARLRAWQTRFFALGLGELEAAAEAGDDHPLVAKLLAWRELADRLDYERLLPRILGDSRLCERELVLAAGERALTNFLHIFEIVLDEMLASRCDVAELARRIGRWIIDTEDSEERNVQRLESERDAVQIMTIHRAKGLEAEVVFLYGGDGQGRQGGARVYHQDGERRLFVGSPAPAAIKEAAAAEERGETERLLYVALTRAARRLYLPCWPEVKEGGRRLAEILNARVQDWLATGGVPGLVAVERVGAETARAPGAQEVQAALAGWQPPALAEPAADPAVARALATQRGPLTTSYTRLKQADAAFDEVLEEVVDPTPPIDSVPRGRKVGIFLHEVLEVVPMDSAAGAPDLAAWSALPAIDRAIRTAALRHDLDPDQPAWRRMLWDALLRPIDVGGGVVIPGVARAARHCREVEFVFPLADARGRERAMVRGAIDLVFEHDGRVFWLDWKSDSLADLAPEAVARHVRAEYALQADIYSLALAKMLGIAGEADHEARFGGLVYLFLRGAAAHVERPRHADLVRLERDLAAREVLG